MQFQPASARADLFFQARRQRGIALAEEAEIHRKTFGGLQHTLHMPRAGRAGGGQRAMRRAGAAAEHGGDAGCQRFFDLLRANEMDMHIKSTRGQDAPFTGDDFRPRANDDVHIGLRIRIARLANRGNPPTAKPNIGFHHAPMIQDQRIGNNGIHGAIGARDLRLTHAIANHLAAAEFHFLTIGGQVAFNLDKNFRIGQAHTVANGWAIHAGISGARDFRCHGSDRPFRFAAKAVDDARACHGYQPHLARLPRFKTHRRASRDIQPAAARLGTIKIQQRIGFREMIMAAHLHRAVALIRHRDFHRVTRCVQRDLACGGDDFTGDHLRAPLRAGFALAFGFTGFFAAFALGLALAFDAAFTLGFGAGFALALGFFAAGARIG